MFAEKSHTTLGRLNFIEGDQIILADYDPVVLEYLYLMSTEGRRKIAAHRIFRADTGLGLKFGIEVFDAYAEFRDSAPKEHIRTTRIGDAWFHTFRGHILGKVGNVGDRIDPTRSRVS